MSMRRGMQAANVTQGGGAICVLAGRRMFLRMRFRKGGMYCCDEFLRAGVLPEACDSVLNACFVALKCPVVARQHFPVGNINPCLQHKLIVAAGI